jgi:PPOX class probable F420-dependent enzyme
MAAFPANYLDLATQKVAFANLATLMPDGTPQVTPIWFDYSNGVIHLNTAAGRVKAQNMREGAPVALSIMDPDNPYRYVQVRGHVVKTTRDGADKQIDAISHKYLGKDYPFRTPGEERISIDVAIDKASASG